MTASRFCLRRLSVRRPRSGAATRPAAGDPLPSAATAASPPPLSAALRERSRRRSLRRSSVLLVALLGLFSLPAVILPAAVPERVAAAAVGSAVEGAPAGTSRHPAAVAAEQAFFAAFNQRAMPAEEVLTPLLGAYAADPGDPRTNLLLGLTHLWIAAEGDRRDARVIEHVILSERFLARARDLEPGDDRIASWLVPMQLSLAGIERRTGDHAAIVADLYAAYETDPVFHSFTVALLGWEAAPGSPAFDAGLAALREIADGECDGDPSCENAPRWPHNVEGFLSFVADYELRAGEPEAARRVLAEVQATPGYADWPYRHRVEARLADFDEHAQRFADDDPANDPPTTVMVDGCAACHAAR